MAMEDRRQVHDYRFMDVELKDWSQASQLAEAFLAHEHPWVFRGQRDAVWRLASTLERTEQSCGKSLDYLGDDERRMITEFRRIAPVHGFDVSDDVRRDKTEPLEWLTMLQHYGGPTRLVDFTRSFWYAVFFALELVATREWPPFQAVWAVNERMLWNEGMDRIGRRKSYDGQQASQRRRGARIECRERIMLDDRWSKCRLQGGIPPAALPFEPERLNPRMAAQTGCFVFPLMGQKTFEENLFATFGLTPPVQFQAQAYEQALVLAGIWTGVVMLRILLPAGGEKRARGHAMLQSMNITARTMFPGVEGVARSTSEALVPWKRKPSVNARQSASADDEIAPAPTPTPLPPDNDSGV